MKKRESTYRETPRGPSSHIRSDEGRPRINRDAGGGNYIRTEPVNDAAEPIWPPPAMNRRTRYDTATLLYRRHSFSVLHMCPRSHQGRPSGSESTICLTAHPELNTHQSVRDNKSVTLLGYLLDPDNAEANDSDIVDRLLDHCLRGGGFENIVKGTEGMGGRWILIVDDGKSVKLFTDPMGLRLVHYTNTSFPGPMWCATQPGLLAKVCNWD